MQNVYDVNANTKAYYKLDGDTTDSSGNGNNGTASNVTWVGGKLGSGSASFNGTTSGINTTWNTEPINTITMMGWVKLNTIVGRGFGWGDTTSGNSSFTPVFNGGGTGKTNWVIRTSGGLSSDFIETNPLTTGVRTHIAITGSTATGYKSYVNGIQNGANATGRTLGTRNFSIGKATNASGYVDGLIDDVIVEDRTWTAQQVLDYYNKTQDRYLGEYLLAGPTVTKGLYHLNGNSTDSSGNGNNGTASNVTWVGGKLGSGSASFNGTTSKISFNNSLSGTTATLSTWVKMNTDTGYSIIVKCGNDAVRGQVYLLRDIAYPNRILIGTYLIGMSTEVASAPDLNDGKWHNVIGTVSGVNYKIYYDGKLVGTYTDTVSLNVSGAQGIIGASTSADFYDGLTDEVIIEAREWTPEEIRRYYTYSRGMFGI